MFDFLNLEKYIKYCDFVFKCLIVDKNPKNPKKKLHRTAPK
jgi:hypothetical protein